MLLIDDFIEIVWTNALTVSIYVVSRLNFVVIAIRVRKVVLANAVALVGRSHLS